MTTATLAITPLTARFAARLEQPLDELLDTRNHEALRAALVDHKVLVIPGASPTIEQHLALGAVFGSPEPPQPQNPRHPDSDIVCVFDSAEGYKADRWHADETFTDAPSSGAALVMRMRPDVGGDTLWLDAEAAHDSLSNGMRTLLANRRARHEIGPGVAAEHPVIRHHPVSGRPCLYVNETFVRGIVNLPPIESEAILAMLLKHLARLDFTYRHVWSDGDIVIWDNRSTQHIAMADFSGRRVVHRVGFVAEPFAA